MSHPLIEIHFQKYTGVNAEFDEVVRHWYHVPQVNDTIELRDMSGVVTGLLWQEEVVYIEVEG